MSIFVEETDLIEITVEYMVKKDGGIVIVDNDPDKTQVLSEEIAKTESIKMIFSRPDFATSQRILSASTSINSDGTPIMNVMSLQNNLIYFLAKSWDVKNEKGEIIELNNMSIGKLKVEIARALVNQLSEKVGQIL